MKQLKKLLVFCLCSVMAFAISACSDGGGCGGDTETATLTSISVNYQAAKTEYYVGEDYSSDGLVVTAVYSDESTNTLSSSDYVIDSHAYDKTTAGTYTINISYTEEDETVTTSYSVTVSNVVESAGLKMTKTTTDYTIGDTISLGDISVYFVLDDVVSDTALDSGDYSLKLAKDGDILDDDGDITDTLATLGEGKYQIWAYMEYSDPSLSDDYVLSTFVFINIIDTLEKIELDTENSSAVYTQSVGLSDTMSSTWTFTATFASSETKQLTSSDVKISGITTTTETTDGVATVSYTYTDALGNETTKTCTVSYTITEAAAGSTTYTFDYDALTAAMQTAIDADDDGDKVALAASYFTGNNAFLSYVGSSSSDVWRSNGSIEIKGAGLAVTFVGTGTITISFGSNGNTSSISLKNSSDTYLTAASYDDGVTAYETGNAYYTASETTAYSITFNITESGTYTIVTNLGNEGRVARIHGITMVDTISGSETQSNDVSIDIANVASSGTVTSVSGGTELVTGTGVYICGESTTTYDLNSSSKAVYDGVDNSTKYAYRLKLGSGITFGELAEGVTTYSVSDVSNALKIDTLGAATITIYVRSSSSSTETGDRIVALYDASGTQLATDSSVSVSTTGDYVYKVTFTVTASGSYFFGSTASGIGIYAVMVTY